MPHLPASIIALLEPFASLFDPRTWRKAQVLRIGAILTPGKRTVSAALHVLGLQEESRFAVYPPVLRRACWSSCAVSRVLLQYLAPTTGLLLLGIEETIARRKGPQIAAKGVHRDGVRVSHSHFVKTTGLRWLCLMWLAYVPWAVRVWALPFLTVLAPSRRYHAARGRRHKTLTDGARQRRGCLRRWWPDRERVVVGDRSYACLRWLAFCQQLFPPITFLTRLRRDAGLHDPDRGR